MTTRTYHGSDDFDVFSAPLTLNTIDGRNWEQHFSGSAATLILRGHGRRQSIIIASR